jgi:hypothetical protein
MMAGVGRHAPLPGTGVAFDAAFLRSSSNIGSSSSSGSVRHIFGVASKHVEAEEAHPSAPAVGETPLDLDIGGEGGYFDHDEVRV